MRLKKNDNVIVIAGNDKGRTGKILKVYKDKNRVIVEGVNIRKRHTKASQKNPQGGIIEKEAPVNASNVMILDSKSNERTRIGSQILIDENTGKRKIARKSVASGELLS